MPVCLAALAAASLLLITRRVNPEDVFREVDGSLLVFFCGLLIVTGSLETLSINHTLFAWLETAAASGIFVLTVISALLSKFVSNVPAVLLFRPFVANLSHSQPSLLVLAMATTLAGNLTLLGSVANLIVDESARRQGVHLSFGTYLRVGVPVTSLSLLIGGLWLALVV